MKKEMKAKTLASLWMGLVLAACGGGSDGDTGAGSAISPDNGSGTTGSGAENAPNPQSTPVSSGDTQFLIQTNQTTQVQVQQSQTAGQKSTNPAVRGLAQQINLTNNIITQQVTQVGQANNVTINTTLSAEQQAQIANLNSLSGTQFDISYVTGIVQSLEGLLATTMAEAQQGSNAQVRHSAVSNLLLIEQNLLLAKKVLVILQPGSYLVDSYQDGLLEIQLSQIALQKASSEQVRQYAQTMITDHTSLNQQISTLAQGENITLPTSLTPDRQQVVAMVSAFNGVDFDKSYMDRNVFQHAKSINKTTLVSGQGTDPEIRNLAAQTLPELQEHLQLALDLANSLQPSAVYQLGQSLTAEIQVAQLVRARANEDATRNTAQGLVTNNVSPFAQLAALAQQRNTVLPLTPPPGQAQAIIQLLGTPGTAAGAELRALLNAQISFSLKTAQSFTANSDAAVSTFAQGRAETLGGRAPSGSTPEGNSTTSTSSTTTTSASSTSTGMMTTTTTSPTTTTAP